MNNNIKNYKVGDTVRSHDFERIPGRPECYVEGVVEGFEERHGCQFYVISVTRRVFSGKEVNCEMGDKICAPMNGIQTDMGRLTDGVELVE